MSVSAGQIWYNGHMKKQYMVMALLALGLLAVSGCNSDTESAGNTGPTANPGPENSEPVVTLITETEAVATAGAEIPESMADKVTITAEQAEGYWTVKGSFYNNTYSFNELGWTEGTDVELRNYGLLEEGNFRLLVFSVDAATGDIVNRIASDSLSMAEDDRPPSINPACGGCE